MGQIDEAKLQNDRDYREVVLAAHQLLHVAGMFTIKELNLVEPGWSDGGKLSVNEILGMATRALADASKEAQGIADGTEDGTWPTKR